MHDLKRAYKLSSLMQNTLPITCKYISFNLPFSLYPNQNVLHKLPVYCCFLKFSDFPNCHIIEIIELELGKTKPKRYS